MRKNSSIVWLAAILLAWSFDQLFWDRIVGLNYVLFILLLFPVLSCFLSRENVRPVRTSYWLFVPLIGFALLTLFRQEPLTRGLSFVFSAISGLTLFYTYSSGRWLSYGLVEYLSQTCNFIFSVLTLPAEYIRSNTEASKVKGTRWFPAGPIMRGVLLALPILAIFTSLLSTADPVFDRTISDLLDLVQPDLFFEYLLRAGVIWLMAYGLLGIGIYLSRRSADDTQAGQGKPPFQPFLGFIETVIILGSLVILFGAFVLIQFKYFFGGIQNIGASAFTYSAYARRGFNELISVAAITLIVLIGLNSVSVRQAVIQRRLYSGLSILMTAEVMVILTAAFRRISLAIDWHGLSRLRVYPQIFLIWLGMALAAVTVLEVLQRTRYITLAGLICSMGFAASLAVFNVDAAIVRYNIDRITAGKHINYPHLASLSIDAVSALVDEFQNPTVSAADHQSIGAVLVCHIHKDDTLVAEKVFWQVFTFSRYNASRSIAAVSAELAGYSFNARNDQPRVKTPDGRIIYCSSPEE